jgi:ParB family chromosome partitioning protein
MIQVNRKLGPSEFTTTRTKLSLFKLRPNTEQPRRDWNVPDDELQRQIIANGGLWEPILVEPLVETDEYQIIDGHRRWFNSKQLVEVQKMSEYEIVPVEITDKPLKPIERVSAWVFIHRQRREWPMLIKEGIAYKLYELVGPAKAADLMGVTLPEINKLVEIYQYARDKFSQMGDPAVTWAREVRSISKKWLSPEIESAIVKKVNEGLITNSKELRKVRDIVKNKKALAEFLRDAGTIDTAMEKLSAKDKSIEMEHGITSDLDSLIRILRSYSWSSIKDLKQDPSVPQKLAEIDRLVKELRDVAGLSNHRGRK